MKERLLGLLVAQAVAAIRLGTAAPGNARKNDPIVLALARGVLYALKQSNGELKWATRVGIDTTVLPQRVPPSATNPDERLLVLSADTQTLTALDTNGDSLWEYPVGQPVLGRPVLMDQRAYLAAYDGWVHEIELAQGKLLGRYPLGQRLTCGGTRGSFTSGQLEWSSAIRNVDGRTSLSATIRSSSLSKAL